MYELCKICVKTSPFHFEVGVFCVVHGIGAVFDVEKKRVLVKRAL